MLRSWWRRLVLGLVLLAGAGFGLAHIPAVQDWLFARGVRQAVASQKGVLPQADHLKVVLCGTSAPPPSMIRAKACTLVMAGDQIFVVDTGPGSANRLSMWRFPFDQLDGVLLTHFHSDHIGDLGEFRMQGWVAGRPGPLPVHGPDGVEKLVDGVNLTYAADASFRGTSHGLDAAAALLVAKPFGLASEEERIDHMASVVIHDAGGLRITAFQVAHEPVYPAVGYRFDYKGRSVVVSGDTALSPNLVRVAKGADLLIHEGQSEEMRATFAKALKESGAAKLAKAIEGVGHYHVTPVQAAEQANDAGVRMLVFNHMGPIAPDNWVLRQIFARGLGDVRPASQWKLGFDGMTIDMPVKSKDILFTKVD
ncbi:MAG: MBL fold metallo-hydrolase [Sphingopyxis sp.]|nr:MBL fold metallo-hydrolase [Sphingopyxis sp.]